MLIATWLPPSDWPRLRETGCVADHSWAEQTARMAVMVVQDGLTIVATALVFVTQDEALHVDGLWIAAAYRRRVSVLRRLRRAMCWAAAWLRPTHAIVATDTAVWMRTRHQRHVSLERP